MVKKPEITFKKKSVMHKSEFYVMKKAFILLLAVAFSITLNAQKTKESKKLNIKKINTVLGL